MTEEQRLIAIYIEKNETELIKEVKTAEELNTQITDKSNFNGQHELVEMICTLSLIAVPLIAGIIRTAIKNKKQIVVKYKGFTIQGLNEKNSVEILKKLIDKP